MIRAPSAGRRAPVGCWFGAVRAPVGGLYGITIHICLYYSSIGTALCSLATQTTIL